MVFCSSDAVYHYGPIFLLYFAWLRGALGHGLVGLHLNLYLFWWLWWQCCYSLLLFFLHYFCLWHYQPLVFLHFRLLLLKSGTHCLTRHFSIIRRLIPASAENVCSNDPSWWNLAVIVITKAAIMIHWLHVLCVNNTLKLDCINYWLFCHIFCNTD